MKQLLCTAILILFFSGALTADVVHLTNGGNLEGQVEKLEGKIKVKTARSTVVIPEEQVESIEEKPFELEDEDKRDPKRFVLERPGEAYIEPFRGFSIRRPNGWAKGEAAKQAAVSFYGPKDGPYTPRLDVTKINSDMDVAELAKKVRETYNEEFPEHVEMYRETADFGDAIAILFTVTMVRDGIRFADLNVIVHREGEDRHFWLTYRTLFNLFLEYESTVLASVRTFRLREPADLNETEMTEFKYHYSRGFKKQDDGNVDGAIESFEKCVELIPSYGDLHRMLGMLYSEKGDEQKAMEAYRSITETEPNNPDAFYNYGTLLIKLGKDKKAVEALEKACELDKYFDRAYTNLGANYVALGENEKAVETLKWATRLNPESVPAHINLGDAYEALGETKKAIREFKDALHLEPDHKNAKAALRRLEARQD